jgi:hypothetical protein
LGIESNLITLENMNAKSNFLEFPKEGWTWAQLEIMVWTSSWAQVWFFFHLSLNEWKKTNKMKENKKQKALPLRWSYTFEWYLKPKWDSFAFSFLLHKQVHNENEKYSHTLHIYLMT